MQAFLAEKPAIDLSFLNTKLEIIKKILYLVVDMRLLAIFFEFIKLSTQADMSLKRPSDRARFFIKGNRTCVLRGGYALEIRFAHARAKGITWIQKQQTNIFQTY